MLLPNRETSPLAQGCKLYIINFCNITLTYQHPGWNDTVNINVWLPLSGWNGRLWALGGGGYSASYGSIYLAQAVGKGFAAIATDSGHQAFVLHQNSLEWALLRSGNLNLPLIEDFGYRTLGELADFGKAVTTEYYGRQPDLSYFNGCSGGGRQAMAIAQRHPQAFDGVLAVAPAMSYNILVPAGYWATHTMHQLCYYPPPCEVDAFTSEAVKACDSLDGLTDRIISAPTHCHFKAADVVRKEFSCNGTAGRFSSAGATVVQAAWDGPQNAGPGGYSWPGLNPGAALTTLYIQTNCSANGTCTATTNTLFSNWYKYLLAQDPKYNLSAMTNEQYFSYIRSSTSDFMSTISASNPDLSAFAQAGGKLLSWQGTADENTPTRQTINYYTEVLRLDPRVGEYYQFYEAPGVGHCFGGAGPVPNGAFDQLMAWVENETVPEVLYAGNGSHPRPLCPYPLAQTFVGNDSTAVSVSSGSDFRG
ncbi:hypothetical protein M409DRAFT_70193 [Zasmidium cellare ATCC 36951]|uniref:Carboxylic ester hydrolase n=1 Tax=Zasmidium cellare ATCC 36951 TaxID=1080233 RepID=A0A6A6C3N9_ZASCE|nr:uncharacterized protein M409DRAFT_70193 [Zasmidium cellare ATCC 36951]KAF2160908.1 hypothetical protein M409DRAFT_70193 [Zasmidium cellare ATCC 36951]